MAQVTIYLNNSLEAQVKEMASSLNISISKFISNILEDRISNEWQSEIKELAGSWRTFTDLNDIRNSGSEDIKREDF